MSEPNEQRSTPREILVATDLSAHSDRAVDRAIVLAQHWNARLVAVHALEPVAHSVVSQSVQSSPSWRRLENRAQAVEWELRADLKKDGLAASVLIEEGDPAEVILRAAEATKADLVIAGMGRNELPARALSGSTLDAIVRDASAPLLVVKKRVRGAYANVVVATDFSDASRDALQTAVTLFDGCNLALFHAFHAPYASFSESERANDAWAEIARDECDRFLARTPLPDDVRHRLAIVIEHGSPGPLLADYCRVTAADVVMLGAPRRGAVARAFVGSRAEELLRHVPCDVMAVPERRGASDRQQAENQSTSSRLARAADRVLSSTSQ
ncbi:MAG TPA: universal stress protein [Burkholderiaceae bacterium]|nr:universal stress protein [Burkholderiaceae bacterium]